MAKDRLSGKLAVILHADVAGSTKLVQQDEQLAHERIQDAFHRFSDCIEKYMGSILELRGDALLADFKRPSDAVSAVLAFQVDQADQNSRLRDDLRPTIRVGIAMGEVVIADSTVTGAGVVLAQRVEQLADPGGLCITAALHEALPTRMPFDLEDLGEQVLKGFDTAVRVYRVELSANRSIPVPQKINQREFPQKSGRLPLVILVAVIVITAGVTYWSEYSVPWESGDSTPPDNPSIVVLPFTNMSGELEQEYFADGMTDDLITDLSKISGLFVIARNSSFTYKGKSVDVKQIGNELGVKYVLEGSVRRAEGKIRVNAQLIDATTGGHLWAERYDRKYKNIFNLQDEVIGRIVTALAINLTKSEQSELERIPTDNLDAYEHYLQGRQSLYSYRRVELAVALLQFEKAISFDNDFADAYAGYARAAAEILRLDLFDTLPAHIARKRAYDFATRALSLDPNLALAHTALGLLHLIDGNYEAAIDSCRRGVAQEPSNPDTHINLALVLAFVGRPSEAVPVMKEAFRLDPNPPAAYELFAGDILFMDGQYEQAIGRLRNALEKTEGCAPCQGGAHLQLAMAYAQLNRKTEAKSEVKALLSNRKWVNLEYFRQLYGYHKRKGDLDMRLDALGKAGMPQWPTGHQVSGATPLSNLELQSLVYGHTWFGRSQNKYQTFAQKTTGDGKITYMQFGTKWEGTISIDKDRLCYQIPALLLGRSFCGYVYSNPQGSREGKDEYIAVDVFDVHHFSPMY